MKIIIFLFQIICVSGFSQILKTKTIDKGGSGPYEAIAASEKSLPEFVIYRPRDIKAAVEGEGKLPAMVFGNGACANTSITHEKLLSEIASHGYIVIAIGALKMANDPHFESTEAGLLIDAIDWIDEQALNRNSDYYGSIDLENIASGGQSCGGAQVMATANDHRIKTYLMFNSGMGDMSMAGASAQSLQSLNGPVLYVVGGEEDIATNNALLDYQRINHVPVAFANMLKGNHGGTFDENYGGSFARMALNWLDWQLKGDEEKALVFLEKNISTFPDWTLKTKNINK